MTTFISHNKADKEHARFLATALVGRGESVWFDEWNIRPGESLVGGIEEGLKTAEKFVLIWSQNAARSKWVGTEVRAYIRRRVDNETLKIIPVLVDETELPVLVADYRGFSIDENTSLEEIASEICGVSSEAEMVKRLNRRISELTYDSNAKNDPLPYIRCPNCGCDELKRKAATDPNRDDTYYFIECTECSWSEWTQ